MSAVRRRSVPWIRSRRAAVERRPLPSAASAAAGGVAAARWSMRSWKPGEGLPHGLAAARPAGLDARSAASRTRPAPRAPRRPRWPRRTAACQTEPVPRSASSIRSNSWIPIARKTAPSSSSSTVCQLDRSAMRSCGRRCRGDPLPVTRPAATTATSPDAPSSSAGRYATNGTTNDMAVLSAACRSRLRTRRPSQPTGTPIATATAGRVGEVAHDLPQADRRRRGRDRRPQQHQRGGVVEQGLALQHRDAARGGPEPFHDGGRHGVGRADYRAQGDGRGQVDPGDQPRGTAARAAPS